MRDYCIGIDLGGTFIKSALVSRDWQIVRDKQSPTPAGGGPDAVVAVMARDALELLAEQGLSHGDIVGIGIGSPGPLDLKNGIVVGMPNIPGFTMYPLRDRVSALTKLPAVLENDANAAALGEFLAGGGRDIENMVLLTLGTGVGSGIIINRRLYRGSFSQAGEVGHLLVEPEGELCGCGQRGCLERYCSATYLAQYAVRRIEAGQDGMLAQRLKAKGTINSIDVNECRKAGDALAIETWNRALRFLAMGCVSLCRLLDPDRIVIGGGMAKAGVADLLDPLKAFFVEEHWKVAPVHTELVLAELGNNAGMIGAAGVAWEKHGQ